MRGNINTDILIGLLSKIVPYHNKLAKPVLPLKLVIMSATLRVEDFTSNKRMFPVQPPVVKVPTRRCPVTIHFNRKTVLGDFVGEAFAKVCKIHSTLPSGGILVFLTGQKEILHLCRRLRCKFPELVTEEPDKKKAGKKTADKKDENEKGGSDSASDKKEGEEGEENEDDIVANDEDAEDFIADVDDYDDGGEEEDDDMIVDPESLTQEERDQIPDRYQSLHVLPLYSALAPPPPETRLVVVATNVAETALTIPGITYVVDCGRTKFVIDWTSKASVD